MATPDTFRKLTDPAIPIQSGAVALNDLLHTVDISDTTDGPEGTSKRTTVQKIFNVVEANLIPPTLIEVTDEGDITTNDINLNGSAIVMDSGAKLRNGTLDNGYDGGISLECVAGYEQEWENGVQYYFPLTSPVIYANSINGVAPGVTFDVTKGYAIASRYRLLNTGVEYVCLDNTMGAAVWDVVGQVVSVNSGSNIDVDNTDPNNPIINSLSDRYKTSSTTSNSVSNGSKNFTVDTDLAYIPLQEILVVYDPAHHMHGEVTSYDSATGALVVDIKNHTGSGTYTSWVLNLDGTPVDAITGSGTINEIAYFTAARIIASLPVATYPSLTELSYVKGVTSGIQTQIGNKQDTLVSGTNIKTINSTSIVGSGNFATPFELVVACSDEGTALSTGTAKITFRMPRAVTLTAVRASLTTAQTSGSIFTVDINEGGTTILSTKITIDNTEKTSTTAATPPVISDTALADDAEMTIDIDQIGDGTAKGLKVMLIGTYA
jgi:hypothetical protein